MCSNRTAIAVWVIGDVADPGKDPSTASSPDMEGHWTANRACATRVIEDHLAVQNKVSRIWGDTKGQATNRDCALVLARSDGGPPYAPEVIDWDEPYKDGGPDAAHARLKEMRRAS